MKHLMMSAILIFTLLLLLAACGDTGSAPAPSPVVRSGTVLASTPGTAPVVVLTPGTGPGGTVSQQPITLTDRTLTLERVNRKPGADASSIAVSITIKITSTTTGPIKNEATFYQLVGAEGDIFGAQSGITPGFYGAIAPGQSRQGTIIFQVPTAAAQSLELLYRPEVARETVLVPLN